MKKFICKLITFVEILTIVGANSMATISYASDQIADSKTSQDNVKVSATINDSNDTKAEINGDVKLKLNISVQNTGYLKDIKFTLDGNNYELNSDNEASSKGSFAEIANSSENSTTSNESSNNVENTVEENAEKTTAENAVSGNETNTGNDTLDNETIASNEVSESKTSTAENTVSDNKTVASNEISQSKTSTEVNTVSDNKETAGATTEKTESNETTENEIATNKIKSINDNVIELNEVNAGESETIEIPITFKKSDVVSKEEYSKESTIKFEAKYVNEKGKEKTVKKSIKQKLEWTANAEEQISQKLVRYLKFDKNTLISFEVKDGIKDNSIPVTNKEINISSPKINASNPKDVMVTGKDINYTYNDGNVKIKKEIKSDSNGNYSFDSQDDYMVTYIYNTQESVSNISTSANANVTNIKGENITAETSNNDFQVTEEVGSIVELNVNAPEQIGKGYLYTNLNRNEKLNTTFSESYKINVGFAELTDKINLKENSNKFTKKDGSVSDAKVKTSKITVDSNEVANVLGDDGTIVVKDGSGKELGTLNKGLSELTIDSDNLNFEISKPKTEGNIVINFEKYIDGNNEYSNDDIKSFNSLNSEVELTSSKSNTQISDKKVGTEIKMTEPTSKATLYVSTDTLSTVVENKDIIFNVVLDTNDISDALYKNPKIKITLPSQVQKIDITDAKVFYDDEITAGSFDVHGNQLIVNLIGLETKYSSLATSNGPLIRIVANISLDNLAPSSVDKIKMEYSNELTGENNSIEGNMNISAPTGFVTTNTAIIDGKSETALENDAKNIEIDRDSTSKKATIKGKLVNNVGQDTNGVIIIGRIPFEGNKLEDGTNLQTTINTRLTSPITTDIQNAKIYYSENGEEQVNGDGWKEDFNSNTKSFMIVTQNPIGKNTVSNFSYDIAFPNDLDYEKVAKESYGVYYKNDAVDGDKYNLIQAKVVGIATNKKPDVTMEISASDINEGYAIDNNGKVTQGEDVLYRVKVTNNGSRDVKNATLKVTPSKNYVSQNNQVMLEYDSYGSLTEKTGTEEILSIDELKVGESKTIEVPIKIVGNLTGNLIPREFGIDKNKEDTLSDDELKKAFEDGKIITTSFQLNTPGIATLNKNFTVREISGTVDLKLTSNVSQKVAKDQKVIFNLNVLNSDEYAKTDVDVKVSIPSEMEFIGDTSVYTYDKNNNTISFKANVDGKNKYEDFVIPVKLTSETDKKLSISASATYDGKEVKSNTIELRNKASSTSVVATQSVNLPSDNMLDTDEVEYYIQINNNSSVDETITFNDELSDKLSVKKTLLKINDNEEEKLATNYINDIITIPAKGTARYTIIADAYKQAKNSSTAIENQPRIQLQNGDQVTVNSVSLNIVGTDDTISASDTNNEQKNKNDKNNKNNKKNKNNKNNNKQEISDIGKNRSIYGTIWFDENNDGIKESKEQKISGVEVKLFDNSTKSIAKDSNGNEIKTNTNDNGEYLFSNIKPGNYIVVADYDNSKYSVGMYEAKNGTKEESSSFVQTKLDKRDVAASNTINISESNVYNQNLALISNNIFDLSLSNTITKITVVNSKDKKQNNVYNFDNNIAKIELGTKNVENTTVLVEYKIRVTNNGKVAGYAKKIVDYIPNGMAFNADLNKDWYITKDGKAYTTKLANTLIEPGETKEVTLILNKKITGENVGNIRNVAEIAEDYNDFGLKDINSTAENKQDGENDMSSANTIILMNAGKTKTAIFGIALGIMTIVAYVVFKVKKDVIDKMMSNYDSNN